MLCIYTTNLNSIFSNFHQHEWKLSQVEYLSDKKNIKTGHVVSLLMGTDTNSVLLGTKYISNSTLLGIKEK